MNLYPLLYSLALVNQAQGPPAYMLQAGPARRVEATLTLEVHAPRLRAGEWIVYAPALPEVPGQTNVASQISPAGKPARELSPLQRPVLFGRVPVSDTALEKALAVRVRYRADLVPRRLVPVKPGVIAPRVAPLTGDERRAALQPTPLVDFKAPAFRAWLEKHSLTRGAAEADLDYARRVFLFIRKGFTYDYRRKMDRHAAAVCAAGKSDCGGLSVVLVAALRAHGIPARILVGRWALSARKGEKVGDLDDYQQQHARVEFFAEKIGWVPADPALAVVHDRSPEGLRFFGRDEGNFLVMHTDHGLVLDSVHFGRETIEWMQGVVYWVSGGGSLDGTTERRDWQVKRGE